MAVARKTTEVGERSERSARQGTGRAKTSGRTKKTGTSKNGKKSAEVRKKNRDTINEYRDHQAFETGITIAVVAIVSLLLYLSYFSLAGKAGMVIGGLMFGFFGWFAWFLPISVLVGYVFLQINAGDKRIMRKSVGVVGIILSLSALTDLIFNNDTIYEYYKINHVTHTGYFDAMFLACKNVMEWGRFNGGLVGRAFGAIFSVILGRVGATLILFALFFFFVYIFYGIEAMAKLRKRNAYRQEMGEIYAQVKEDEEYREPSYRVFTFSENKNRRQMPMRTLEKVPKVQTFDLRGQAEFFKEDEKKKRSVFENENEKYFEEEAEDENIADANPVDTNTLDGNTLDANTLDVNTVDEDAAKDKMADIPIYRNELEEKFGQKKDAALIPSQQMVREEEHFGLRESAFDRFEKRKEEIREQNIKMEPLEEISFSDHDRDSLEEMTADGFAYDEGNAVENGSVDYREEIETTFAEEKVEAFVEKTEVETSDEKDEMEAVVSPFDMDDSFEEMEEDSRLDDFEDDSVMIMDDFVPQKPMNSFAPKEETDRITLDSAEQDPSAGVERLTVSSGNGNSGRKHPDMGNGSRVFSDFSSVTKHASDGRAEGKREVPEEK
ncbi:MAG: hypothetical protein IJ733_00335, partial [Lachnospiraceae bacterium]|nr:hypothetical protein [Lachnospiraceae bacterium]